VEVYEDILGKMKQTFAKYAGYQVEEASDLEIRLKVLAGEIYSAFTKLEWLKKQMFPQTATDSYLTMHGQQRGLERKEAQAAVGTLTFSRTEALSYDLPIPLDTVCAVDKQSTVRYVTIEEATLKANTVSVTVKAKAKKGGRDSNTAVNTVTTMITPPSGIKSVTNNEPFVGGMDAEDDFEFRSRLLTSYRNISNGTNAAFYKEFATAYPNVSSAGVVAKENGVGTISVYVAARGGVPSDEMIAELQRKFDQAREINVLVTVKAPVLQAINVAIQIKPAVQYSFSYAKEICIDVIERYIGQIGIGGVFRISEMCKLLMETGAIVNYKTNSSDVKLTQSKLAVKGSVTILEGGGLN